MADNTRDKISDITIDIGSSSSLIHMGSLDSFDITKGGIEAAGKILEYLENGSEEALKGAIDIYNHIIPNENFGGEYTALLWVCRLFLASEEERREYLAHPMVESWFDLLARDDYENLKEYLKRKYHYIENEKEDPIAKVKLRFLEDFILFNNPDRERWDKTSDNIRTLNLREGDHVIDIGSGPGYFTFKFADIVGETGHVYAVETNVRHLDYLNDFIKKYGIKNVDVVEYATDGSSMKKLGKADLIYMCSLYHVIYSAYTDGERDIFIEGIKNCLKEDGRFVIIDNDLVEGEDLPYHGPYISRSLIISQLWHYGFELAAQYQFSPQRYVLEFKMSKALPAKLDPSLSLPAALSGGDSTVMTVTSRSSLVRYRMIGTSSQGYTRLGKKAARLFYSALESKERASIEAALSAYDELIPKERIGDEYTAFQWICRYMLAVPEKQKEMLYNVFDAEYYNSMADDDYAFLKRYLRIKYDLEKPDPDPEIGEELHDRVHDVIYEYTGSEVSFDQLNDWNEYVSFNNPNRESWEKTSQMLSFLNIREGEAIADVGCGFGFFTFKFAQMAGRSGKVYSTEINKDALAYVKKINEKFDLNIETVEAKLNDICLPENSVDTIFLCSMYHAVYIASIEFVKDEFIASLKKALKKGGRLVVVDNAITQPPVVPYFGSGIAKELAIAQLKYYGFSLVKSEQFIPQRYILIFRKD